MFRFLSHTPQYRSCLHQGALNQALNKVCACVHILELVSLALLSELAAPIARAALWLLHWPLVLVLRAAVRSRIFWENGLASAW